jgi:hypothetical protein
MLKWVIITVVLVLSIVLLSMKMARKGDTMARVVDILYRQCARWAVASQQDKSDIIAVLHANYAAGYLWSIKDIVPTNEFQRITGADFLEFEKRIVKIQDDATRRLVRRCRSAAPVPDQELLDAIYGKHKK